MNTSLRWSAAIIIAGMIGFALAWGGVALGRSSQISPESEPGRVTPDRYRPANAGLNYGPMESRSVPAMRQPGVTERNMPSGRVEPGADMIGSDRMGGRANSGMMGFEARHESLGSEVVGPAAAGDNAASELREAGEDGSFDAGLGRPEGMGSNAGQGMMGVGH